MGTFELHRATAEINGIKIFYRDTKSDKPPMVCLHGRWGRGETWIDLISRYYDRYRIIAPDQRGHGLSDKPIARYTAEDMAGDIHGLITQLGCGPAIVVGHSMGGRIAAQFTASYPEAVKALAILDEPADGPEQIAEIAPENIPADDKLTSEWPTPYRTYADAVAHLSGMFRETNVRYFLDSLVETVEGYDYLFSRRAMAAIGTYSRQWYDLLPKITCPVLLVRAADSWCLSKASADKMRPLIKDCTYFEVTNSDHAVYADNPAEFYAGFDNFLNCLE